MWGVKNKFYIEQFHKDTPPTDIVNFFFFFLNKHVP